MNTNFLHQHLRMSDSQTPYQKGFWQTIHIDLSLMITLSLILLMGLVILYSAGNQELIVVESQVLHIALAFGVMFMFAQIPPETYRRWGPWIYMIGFFLLVIVLIMGHIGKGAQRWLNLGFMRLQPSEIMKLAIPMLLAWYFDRQPLPLTSKHLFYAGILILLPALLTAKQPDLGTAILLIVAGTSVLFLAGLSWSIMTGLAIVSAMAAPLLWYVMHDYQRKRVLTFLNPENDPLGAGYHIIQSKIAIGSGGFFGKGWLNGTQSHLHFLPEHTTDFIFAVCGEEFGFFGALILITLFMAVVLRGIYITMNAQDTFSRLLAGSLTMTFFVSFFVNIGMVTGVLPVVGIPLPLVSYGGSSMVTLMASFGMLMSIQTHRKLITT